MNFYAVVRSVIKFKVTSCNRRPEMVYVILLKVVSRQSKRNTKNQQ